MTGNNDDDRDEGLRIKLESLTHYHDLLKQGYEVSGIRWQSRQDLAMVPTLRLQRSESDILTAEASEIADYVLHLQSLPDFEKGKESFIWVPETGLYFDLEERFMEIVYGDYKAPIITRQVSSKFSKLMYETMVSWLQRYANHTYKRTRLSQIFNLVCVLKIRGNSLQTTTVKKDVISIRELQTLLEDAANYDECIALSFFYLSEKVPRDESIQDLLIGSVAYDLKRRTTLCFNIQSREMFYREHPKGDPKDPAFLDIIRYLFERSIDSKLACKSFLPLPVYTLWYPPLPWITFVALSPVSYNQNIPANDKALGIPEFFVFGCPAFITEENSFHFAPFSPTTSGHATVILRFNDSTERIRYNMRFDQWSGQTLVHLDYSFYAPRERKLIEHYPLDLEEVYNFSPYLFIAILAAGVFDGHFSGIIEKGLKGVKELVNKNPAYFYPLKHIWAVENAIQWLRAQPNAYSILEKFASKQVLTADERTFIDTVATKFIGIIAKERNTGQEGLGIFGFAILHRQDRSETYRQRGSRM